MKKWLCIVLAAALAAGMAGCSLTADAEKTEKPEPTPSIPVEEPSNANSGFDYSEGITDEGYFEGVTATKYVTLPEYKGIEVPKSVAEASQEDLDIQVEMLLEEYVTYESILDRAVADGDTIHLDYVGTIDGVEFDGGSTMGMGREMIIGVDTYIDGFQEQIIGHMPGETFDIEVTLPDDYHDEELQGKDAVFSITVHSIQGDPIAAELNDEIAADYGFATVDELLEDIRAWLISEQKTEFFDELIAEAACEEIPQTVLDYCAQMDIAYYQSYAEAYGVDLETVLADYTGFATLEEYMEAYQEDFRETAVYYLAVQAIAEKEGLTATEEDVLEAGYGDFVDTYGMPYMKMYVLQNVIVPNYVIEQAKLV